MSDAIRYRQMRGLVAPLLRESVQLDLEGLSGMGRRPNMDRFPAQVHLEPSDISEVTSRRVLAKNAAAQAALGKLYDEHRGRLTEHTRLSADIKLPELSRDAFTDLYPLLPYQIDLIIQVVSGLRTQGGSSKHVGGANRTIIKLAQQLLINPGVDLAGQPVGALARLDHVYDLVEGNIASEIRAKIAGIPKAVAHPRAQAVAKAICLLRYVKSVHSTAENIAAALHPAVGADSELAVVKEALRALEAAHLVRQGEGGYRIPTPAEDDWERLRNGISAKPGDIHRLHQDVLTTFWQPKPSHTLYETRTFKAGLAFAGRPVEEGDLMFQVHFSEAGKTDEALAAELRVRSQSERQDVFWEVAIGDAIMRETDEVFRSREMLARKEREARTGDETALITEEKVRLRLHNDELRRLLKVACLGGSVFFQGNDRSPGDKATDVGKSAAEILGHVLPDVFDRFREGAAKAADAKKGTDALGTAENLTGLPAVFHQLGLLRDAKGKTVFNLEAGPLHEVHKRIEDRASYGAAPSGKYLQTELEKEPFGWDFEVVRLLVLSLLRAGKIEAVSKGQTIDSATSLEGRELFGNNNHFKAASFRPKGDGTDPIQIIDAAEAVKDTFGREVKELTAQAVVVALREELLERQEGLSEVASTLRFHQLPGTEVIDRATDDLHAMLRGSESSTIATFIGCHKTLKDGLKRSAELAAALTAPRLEDIKRTRRVLGTCWPFLQNEPDLSGEDRGRAEMLVDLLQGENFYKELPKLEQAASKLEAEYKRRAAVAIDACRAAYDAALAALRGHDAWPSLSDGQQAVLGAALAAGRESARENAPIPQVRAITEACGARLKAAVAELHRVVDGERLAQVSLGSYFAGGIETEEQLDAALAGMREECARLIGAGKKVIAG